MIKVSFNTNDYERSLSLKVEGHAGSNVIGQDLVCASASILTYTVAQIVSAMEQDGELEEALIETNEGDARISIRCKTKEAYKEAAHTFFVAVTGYKLLEHNFPQYVELQTVGQA